MISPSISRQCRSVSLSLSSVIPPPVPRSMSSASRLEREEVVRAGDARVAQGEPGARRSFARHGSASSAAAVARASASDRARDARVRQAPDRGQRVLDVPLEHACARGRRAGGAPTARRRPSGRCPRARRRSRPASCATCASSPSGARARRPRPRRRARSVTATSIRFPSRPERLMRPGVRREHQRVLRGRAAWRRRRRPSRLGTALAISSSVVGAGDAVRPVRPRVQLDRERQPGPLERAQVVGDAVALGLARLLEPGGEQRRLRALGVVGEQVEVAEAAQARTRVVERDLGSLEEDERPVPRIAHAREQRDHGEVADRGASPRRAASAPSVEAVGAAAPRLEQLDAMEPQRLLVRRPRRAGWSTRSHISVQPQRPVAVLARERRAEAPRRPRPARRRTAAPARRGRRRDRPSPTRR